MRLIVTVSLVLATLLAATGDADAQRRRRRRPPPQETTTEPAEPVDAGVAPPQEGAQATPGADPAAQQTPVPEGTEPPPEEGGPAAGTEAEEDDLDPYADEPLGPDLGPIRDDFTALMDELVQVRSKVAVLGRQLFRTRMTVTVQNRASDDNSLESVAVSLDGAPLFRGTQSDLPGDVERQVFDGFAAPGPHVLMVEIEQRAREDDDYRYTQRDGYRFQVVRNRLSEVTIILDDDSDMAEDFEDDGEGEYDVRMRVRVATRALDSR
jgi:hypothetical protein